MTRQDRAGHLAHATFSALTMQTLVRITIHTTPEKFENATITCHFEFVFDMKTRSGKSHDYRDATVFKKLRFQNVFRPHENELKSRRLQKFLRFEEHFRKAPFS